MGLTNNNKWAQAGRSYAAASMIPAMILACCICSLGSFVFQLDGPFEGTDKKGKTTKTNPKKAGSIIICVAVVIALGSYLSYYMAKKSPVMAKAQLGMGALSML